MTETFVEYVVGMDFRFYQERKIGLDLYHSGALGQLVACLTVASVTIFSLGLFHLIPRRKHLLALLLGIGALSVGCGLLTSYLHYSGLPETEAAHVRAHAGPAPSSPAQTAAVLCLPLMLGAANLAFNLVGALFLTVFWGGDRSEEPEKKKAKAKAKASAK